MLYEKKKFGYKDWQTSKGLCDLDFRGAFNLISILLNKNYNSHTWNNLGHLGINGQSHDSVKQS